jgi:hypothetical protein
MGDVVVNDPRGSYRVNSGRRGPMSDGQRKLVDGALEEGALSVNEVALAAGVSSRTIVRYRAKRKAESNAS